MGGPNYGRTPKGDPATDAAREWEGWGTALKPAFEPVVVARKPLGEKTVAANVLAHGTGALNIDATRIGTTDKLGGGAEKSTTRETKGNEGWERPWMDDLEARDSHAARVRDNVKKAESLGRWPANVALDESQAAALDEQSGPVGSNSTVPGAAGAGMFGHRTGGATHDTRASGGASRFFYVAKAPKSERPVVDGTAHPTVKPLALMRWLIRLVTPPGGCVVDPFAGSGTTLEAAYLEGFESIGVEMTPDYWPLITHRIERITS
jgi:hypothetical protein